jgi:carbon-monoxide dehydrogenase small subunit
MNETDSTPRSTVRVTVNDETYERTVEDRKLLVHFLREDLGLTGTHQGCVVGKCGACTVLHEGIPKKACMLYAVQVDGDDLTTVEGLADIAESEGIAMETRGGTALHPLQMGFKQNHGLQCGFCTPGFLITSYAFLQAESDPEREEIKDAISGNICRCTGYNSIVDSIEWAAAELDGRDGDAAVAAGDSEAGGGCCGGCGPLDSSPGAPPSDPDH